MCYVISLVCGSKELNTQTKQNRHTEIETKLMVARGRAVALWGGRGGGIQKLGLAVTEQSRGCKAQLGEYSP